MMFLNIKVYNIDIELCSYNRCLNYDFKIIWNFFLAITLIKVNNENFKLTA